MTDCTFTNVAAGPASARRGRNVRPAPALFPAPGRPAGQVGRVGLPGLARLGRWLLATSVAATGASPPIDAPAERTTAGPTAATPGPDRPGRNSDSPDAPTSSTAPAGGPDPTAEPDRHEPADQRWAALVARASRGDSDAFGELYDHYADRVFRYALYRVGGDPAAAEDVVSETFLRALRMIGAFTWQGRDIGAWFITIARNLLVDQARSARRRFEIPTADILAAADRGHRHVTPGPEELIVAGLTRQELLEAIQRLGPDQRECIALRFLEEMSVRETALAMGRNEGAVRALQLRAVRTLARSLPAHRSA
ncbi:sigma-70 family RNA polymerase sigma factor [Frankia sp. AgPm24]|uniref:sigma-70 family RNA polymerase sigma factor n=1 Tax=Frankia sp. AgPm24 TaxID=631128 RepID=UPI00200F5219|nr:sigma-70 family RNA polymerase sigma factor [Frankia sp. AgPm24]MCK9924570.1 sigma-70 family RNA polymerase sigma factor [Frankia sp. AgPm24]